VNNTGVYCYDLDGKRLGYLTPQGGANHKRIFACLFTPEQAAQLAKEINDEGQYRAKVRPVYPERRKEA
jgi:hypothetical protein